MTKFFINPLAALSTALLLSSAVEARISDALLSALPSPLNFLARSNQAGSDLEKGLLSNLVNECPHLTKFRDRYLNEGCDIPALSRKYSTLVQKMRSGTAGLLAVPQQSAKPWDLSVLLSGNFYFVPTIRSETEGRDLMIDLFMTRNQILVAVERSYTFAKTNGPKPVSPEQTMLAPFMRAYFLTSTPMGALNETFRSLQCGLHEPSCEIEKRVWGSVCHLAVEQNEKAFSALENRFSNIVNDASTPELTRTKFIQELADYLEAGQFDREMLAAKIDQLESGGQGANAAPDYVAITLAVLIYGEIKQLMSLKYNCLTYDDDLSEKTKALYRKKLEKLTGSSLDEIDKAFSTYGATHELGV